MGFLSSLKGLIGGGVERARARRREAIVEEATRAGSRVVEIVDAGSAPSEGSVVANSLKAFVGGSVRASDPQVFILEKRGLVHAYAQPYTGMQALPGEHHVLLDGGLAKPVVLRKGLLGGISWEGGLAGDHPLNSADTMRALKALKWKWTAGLTEIELEWAVQVRPAGTKRVHLVMQAGRYGGFTTYGVGMKELLTLALHVTEALRAETAGLDQEFLEPCGFADVVEALSLSTNS
jgi:hypothetical protein